MGGTYRHFGFLDAVAFFVNKDNPLARPHSPSSMRSFRRPATAERPYPHLGASSA